MFEITMAHYIRLLDTVIYSSTIVDRYISLLSFCINLEHACERLVRYQSLSSIFFCISNFFEFCYLLQFPFDNFNLYLKSDSHLPKIFALFTSIKAL